MARWRSSCLCVGAVLMLSLGAIAQQQGAIRGVVYDDDFDAPLAAATVTIADTGETVTTTEQGNYVFPEVPPGTYTLVFSKDGYVRQVRANVVVTAGQLTNLDVRLAGDFTEMEEFVVEDILGSAPGSEAGLLQLRFESPALLDSIGSDLARRAGASDAAAFLNLVAGATTQDGKFAVIRGLPDRYVSSQMNGVRLPTADEDKRAVELDLFPAAVIESVQVSKTFTPDQQGDASGGAVNVILKGIPDASVFQFRGQVGWNSQVESAGSDFLTYDGGGVSFWGRDDGRRDIQFDNLGDNWNGAVGVSRGDAPPIYKWSLGAGHRHTFNDGVTIGGYGNFFYERDAAFFDNGVNNSLWVESAGQPLTPERIQIQGTDDFKTRLFDVTQGSESVQWGGLATFGLESENHLLGLTYLGTRGAEDKATLAEDTRGKEFFFPGYDPDDPGTPGHDQPLAAPYIRTETLEYTERTAQTLQLNGRHILPDFWGFNEPVLDWTLAHSTATLDQPDKRQFGTFWLAEREPIPGFIIPANHRPFKPAANFTLGNLQRIYKQIEQESDQGFANLKLPFEQWDDQEAYLKLGVFGDSVDRVFRQETYSNFGEVGSSFDGDFDDFWSAEFPNENHPITDGPPFVDVDYIGDERILAGYGMMDLPLTSDLNVVGGVRFESTDISIVNIPEQDALWFPPGASGPVALNPGEADVDFSQNDWLPALALTYQPVEEWTFRAAYSQTVARMTFKELTPIIQQEFLGGPIFIGNPDLQMSNLTNYDLRVDYTPYPGGLLSASWFYKDVEDPIEFVQRVTTFTFTTPVNYPEGFLTGFELEYRQDTGYLWDALEGLQLGVNATFIDSEVTLPDDLAGELAALGAPITKRDATGAPEHLFNINLIYDSFATDTQIGVFYTITGDTLVAGAGESNGRFVPNIYATEFDSLNLTISQRITDWLNVNFQAKNLTNSERETVYRSAFSGPDATRTSFTEGIDLSIGIGGQVTF